MKPRCPHCGSAYAVWNRDTLIAAATTWFDEHGAPPKADDWQRGVPEHPARATVYRVFGSWGAFLEAAGFKANNQRWNQRRIVQALYEWRYRHGRMPTSWDWDGATAEHPSRHTVKLHFGSWNAMFVEAGYEPSRPTRSDAAYRRQASVRGEGWEAKRARQLEALRGVES